MYPLFRLNRNELGHFCLLFFFSSRSFHKFCSFFLVAIILLEEYFKFVLDLIKLLQFAPRNGILAIEQKPNSCRRLRIKKLECVLVFWLRSFWTICCIESFFMRNHYPDYIYSSEWIVMRSHLDDSKKSSNSSSSNRRQAGRKNDIKPESTSWQIIQNVRSWPLAHTMNAQQIVSLKISFRIIHVVWFIFFSLSQRLSFPVLLFFEWPCRMVHCVCSHVYAYAIHF